MRKGSDIRPSQYRRLWMFTLLLVLAFGGLGYRLVDLQVLRHEELRNRAMKALQRTQVQPTRRGQIYDARGQVLATSMPVKSVTVNADPTKVGDRWEEIARALAPSLGISWERVAAILQRGQVGGKKSVQLRERVPSKNWEQILEITKELGLPPFAIFGSFQEGEKRLYPNGPLAAHVLGFAGPSQVVRTDAMPELVGKSGIEARMNEVLSGTLGMRQVMLDGELIRSELVAMRSVDVAAREGLGVVLTLDAGIQHIVESEIAAAYSHLKPISVTCVVVRPRTGEILAMANVPTFDPNHLEAADAASWRNRAITDVAEPGSTFKALIVTGALEEGLVNLNTPVQCEGGAFRYKGEVLHDVSPHGVLRVEEVIAKSSNIGAAKIGIMMGEKRLYHYMRAFGMGETTRLPLGGEVAGIVNPLKKWSAVSTAYLPMGHEVATTPLQMVMAISAIANGGQLMRPMLVKALVDEAGQPVVQFEPTAVRRVVSERSARQMTEALKTAVVSGTGKKAKLEFYEAAGKTGTSQKLINGEYSSKKHFVSFIGFFPADDPELCISVAIDEPKQGYGGETAAPVWKRIADRASSYLGIPPTQGVEAPMLTGPARAGGKH